MEERKFEFIHQLVLFMRVRLRRLPRLFRQNFSMNTIFMFQCKFFHVAFPMRDFVKLYVGLMSEWRLGT